MPSIYGFNLGVNALHFLRVSGGVGFIKLSDPLFTVDAKTFNGEAKLMVPEWGFSPFACGGLSKLDATVTGAGDLSALGGLNGSGTMTYIGGGFDWQTSGGFNLGFSYKYALVTNGKGLPGIYMGWYF